MPEPTKTGKILRGCRAFWLSFDEEKWTCLGKDTDDLSIELNPDTEQVKNVQGEVTFVNNGYTPSLSNDSYIARYEDAIYEPLQTIVDTLATDDARTSATLLVATLTDQVKESATKTLIAKVPEHLVMGSPLRFQRTVAEYRVPSLYQIRLQHLRLELHQYRV